jgi:secretion/DNA translocation related TadE-like protein
VSRPTGERGSATVLVVALAAVLLVVAAGIALVGAATVARHRAESAADLAALSAAAHALEGDVAACRWAATAARRSGGELVACRLDDAVADVVVRARLATPAARFGAATSRARAGPDGGAPKASGTYPDE